MVTVAAVAMLGLAQEGGALGASGHHHAGHPAAYSVAGGHVSGARAVAVGFARAQVGHPYHWGATGPVSFDCSGLTMTAWAHAGVNIARTSQEQWATLRHIGAHQLKAGDLVFFTGALQPGEVPPGHVGLVINPRLHLMVDAYGVITGVVIQTYGLPSSPAGLTDPTGYVSPFGG